MSKREIILSSRIYGIHWFPRTGWMPCGLNFYDKLWWRFMPGAVINVQWPNGPIVKEFIDQYKTDEQWLSADPNDHYRPWLEEHVGKQGWDWNWGMADRDATENRLTIKIRQKYAKYATIAALRWS
jgi:hypothetical protein